MTDFPPFFGAGQGRKAVVRLWRWIRPCTHHHQRVGTLVSAFARATPLPQPPKARGASCLGRGRGSSRWEQGAPAPPRRTQGPPSPAPRRLFRTPRYQFRSLLCLVAFATPQILRLPKVPYCAVGRGVSPPRIDGRSFPMAHGHISGAAGDGPSGGELDAGLWCPVPCRNGGQCDGGAPPPPPPGLW